MEILVFLLQIISCNTQMLITMLGFEWFQRIPFQVYPTVLMVVFVAIFIWFQFKSRFWLLTTLINMIGAPFRLVHWVPIKFLTYVNRSVLFRDFFFAEQLLSIAIVLYDLEYTICWFVSDAWTSGCKCLLLSVKSNCLHSSAVCMDANVWTRPLLAMIPAILRILQCLRRYKGKLIKYDKD